MIGFIDFLFFACWLISIILFIIAGAHLGRLVWDGIKHMFVVWRKIGFDSVHDRKYTNGPESKSREAKAAREISKLMGTNPAVWKAFACIVSSGLVAALLVCFGLLFLVSETWFIVGGIIEIIIALVVLLGIHFSWTDFEISIERCVMEDKEYNSARIKTWLFRIICFIAIIAGAFCIIMWFSS